MSKHSLRVALAAAALLALPAAHALAQDSKPIRIGMIEDSTGPLQAYVKQVMTGFNMGIEYATKGTNTVAGRKLEFIVKDSQTKPELGRSLLESAYSDDGDDLAIGGSSSAVALAMLPVAQEQKKILIVDAGVADSITGSAWNRYIFRVDRNSSQDAISNALAIGKPGVVVATLAQDYAFGRDGVAAFRTALATTGAKLVHEEYAPTNTTDFTAAAQRIFDALSQQQGEKILFVIWAGADPMTKLAALNPSRLGITLATGGNILPSLKAYNSVPALNGMQGATYYYFAIPQNPINDWLVKEHQARLHEPPDFFTADGMSTAMALVTALQKTDGKTDAESLIAAMEGMKFETPKGTMQFRAADHQALQSMYGFKLKVDPSQPWAVPELTKVYTIDDMKIPIANTR
jgi:branched-chain amino acid transport system substrate-binding protein